MLFLYRHWASQSDPQAIQKSQTTEPNSVVTRRPAARYIEHEQFGRATTTRDVQPSLRHHASLTTANPTMTQSSPAPLNPPFNV